MCPQIGSPQVIGLRHPVVLLPEGDVLSPEESAMALDHELAHLRRGDLWLAWVPALAQRLFFFHPLVAWSMREYALYREAACDVQVVQHGHSAPQDYGRLLLRLGVAHPLHAGLAGASPTFENLKRRLTMLQQTQTSSRLRSGLLVALIAVVGVTPYRVTAHSEPAVALPDAAASTAPERAPLNLRFGYAWIDKDKSVIQNMSTDSHAARRLSQHGEPVFLVQKKGQAYVIRDPAILSQVGAEVARGLDATQNRMALARQRIQLTQARDALASAREEMASAAPADRQAVSHALAERQAALQKEQATVEKQEAILRGNARRRCPLG